MSSVFQKLLRKEFGKEDYEDFCMFYEKYRMNKNHGSRIQGNRQVYNYLYEMLKNKERPDLEKRMERLLDSMCIAVNINRHYILFLAFYLAGALFLIMQELNSTITVISLLLISAVFIYKTWEYVINKFCYVDANIVLVYKSVLDRLLSGQKKA